MDKQSPLPLNSAQEPSAMAVSRPDCGTPKRLLKKVKGKAAQSPSNPCAADENTLL